MTGEYFTEMYNNDEMDLQSQDSENDGTAGKFLLIFICIIVETVKIFSFFLIWLL